VSVNQTNVMAVQPTNFLAQKNAMALPQEDSGLGSGGALAVGGALLVAAGGLVVFMMRRSRKNSHASLITRTMRKS